MSKKKGKTKVRMMHLMAIHYLGLPWMQCNMKSSLGCRCKIRHAMKDLFRNMRENMLKKAYSLDECNAALSLLSECRRMIKEGETRRALEHMAKGLDVL